MKDLIWSPLADEDLDNVIEYLLTNWSNKIAAKFLEVLYKQIDKIIVHPKHFPTVYGSKNYRKCVITKHNTLFYKEFKNGILILRIFDTRQNPKKF